MISDDKGKSRSLRGNRAVGLLLLALFSFANIYPIFASRSPEPVCNMSCCRRGSHAGGCCCKKQHSSAHGDPVGWRSAPSCPPGCSSHPWIYSQSVTPATLPSGSVPLRLRAAVADAAPGRPAEARVVLHAALFQRPPPSLLD